MTAALALYMTMALVAPRAMGLGDVKLAGILALLTGWLGWPAAGAGIFSAFLLAGLVGGSLIAAGRANRKTTIPFGRFMLIGSLAGTVIAVQVAGW
jgi:leader peptidase (prepilin peptidase) / N-methyltransferase